MTHRAQQISLDDFFDGSDPASRALFERIAPIVSAETDTLVRWVQQAGELAQ